MNRTSPLPARTLLALGLACAPLTPGASPGTPAAPGQSQILARFSGETSDLALHPAGADARVGGGALRVRTGRDGERPGVALRHPAGRWDLSRFTGVEVAVRNSGTRACTLNGALENDDADRATRENCCIGSIKLEPGEEGVLAIPIEARLPEALAEKLRGMRATPGGFRDRKKHTVDPARVTSIAFWIYRPGAAHEFEVREIRAGGTPAFPLPANPDDLFPMIDRFGQYIHKDWPGKTRSEADLHAAREAEASDLASRPGPPDRDRFGGWSSGPKLEATGRFRVEKWRGRWWFVDPDGHLFWSHGLVRVTWSSGYTPVAGREHLFADLPAEDSPLAIFYGRSIWAISGLYERGARTYNFSGANLLRKYGGDWPTTYADLCHRRFRSWGLNTLANCSQPAIYLGRRTPYTATVYSADSAPDDSPGATGYVATIHDDGRVIEGTSGGWGKFPDTFDPSFKSTLLKEIALHRGKAVGDPWCLGYFPGNELSWGADDTALARAVLSSPAEQPAKRALIDDLRARHGTVEKLNASWKTSHASWDALLRSTTPPAAADARGDLVAFLDRMADSYFRQCREAVKEVDPGGLYLGCRFAGWSHPQVFRAAAKYSDVVSVNRYTESLADLRLPDGIDRPVLIGEFHFGALDRGKFHASLRGLPDQRARAAAYERYVRSALENPLVVGTHWHQFGDQATTGRDDGENFQNGFVDVCDTPYTETIEACRAVGERLYQIRAGALPKE